MLVGRYLMRHCNAIVMGWFLEEAGASRRVPQAHRYPRLLLRIAVGWRADRKARVPAAVRNAADRLRRRPRRRVDRAAYGRVAAGPLPARSRGTVPARHRPADQRDDRHRRGQAAIAENRVALASGPPNRFGMPPPTIAHRYDARDLAARDVLVGAARRILRTAGAIPLMFPYNIQTFSHAVGTVRMGVDPRRSPLDERGAFRGVDNLFVSRWQRPAALGRRESVAHDRGQRAATGDAHRRDAMTARIAFLGTGARCRHPYEDAAAIAPDVRRFYASRERRPRRGERPRDIAGAGHFDGYAAALESREIDGGARRRSRPRPTSSGRCARSPRAST